MRILPIDSIQGGEVLAKDIYLENGAILMSEGSILRPAYIDRLKSMGYNSVYIVDKQITNLLDDITEQAVQKQCHDLMIETIDRYSYGIDTDLTDINNVAENVIREVVSQPEVLYNITRVRDKSESIYLHSINVAALSALIGVHLKLPERRLKNMTIGALLHDIGLIYIPYDLNHINLDNCEESVVKEIRKHVIFGYSAVEKETWLSVASKDIIINHHERIDGSGYPFHLSADKLSLETKIVSLCDEFDDQVYGNFMQKRKVHETMDYILSQAGIKFDFKVAQKFVSSVAVYPIGTVVCTNEDETGVVIRQNTSIPTRPVIRIIKAPKGSKYPADTEKDLAKSLTTFIVDTIDI